MEILAFNFFVAHGLVLAAWALWFWRDRRAMPHWRRYVLLLGVVSATLNVAMFWALVTYSTRTQTNFISLRDGSGSIIDGLALVTLASAIVGKGTARGAVAAGAVSGFLLWVVPGIL